MKKAVIELVPDFNPTGIHYHRSVCIGAHNGLVYGKSDVCMMLCMCNYNIVFFPHSNSFVQNG